MSPSLINILEILFPGVEAEVAVKLPLENKTVSELKDLFPEHSESLGNILDRMARRGTVLTGQSTGEERQYRLLPCLVGWAETPFWAGKETEDARKLAPLWLKYREEAFGEELARNGMPITRVVPIERSLRDESQVLPFDVLKEMIGKTSYGAVGHCPCRQIMKYAGEGCKHSLENCLHFNSMGRYMVEQGMARQVTHEEAIKIVAEADDEGLVHVVENIDGFMSTICNCCGCCCVFLDTKKKFGLHTLSSSNYVSQVDRDICAGCGTCEERCPMEAVTVGDDDVARVNGERCIGCGVCTPSCSTGAVALIQRQEIKPPPELSEFLAARFKAQ
jgi:NAD-dependent dihydropyrimidine dehydrogenase PreA subunit